MSVTFVLVRDRVSGLGREIVVGICLGFRGSQALESQGVVMGARWPGLGLRSLAKGRHLGLGPVVICSRCWESRASEYPGEGEKGRR